MKSRIIIHYSGTKWASQDVTQTNQGMWSPLAVVHWVEKGEEELDEGGKWHLSITWRRAGSAERAQHHLLPAPPAGTGSPFISLRVNPTCHLPDEPHGPLCGGGEVSACICQHFACTQSSRSDAHASHRLCWAIFKHPHMDTLFFNSPGQPEAQKQREVNQGVPASTVG